MTFDMTFDVLLLADILAKLTGILFSPAFEDV
jgi:hypothetical protein